MSNTYAVKCLSKAVSSAGNLAKVLQIQ